MNLVMIKLNLHENDAVTLLVNYGLVRELNPLYNFRYPFVCCCCGDDGDDDDGEGDFVCHSLDAALDFVDLKTIAMDHNVEFRYLNRFSGRKYHSYYCGQYCNFPFAAKKRKEERNWKKNMAKLVFEPSSIE